MNNEKGGILLQVITTATISLVLVSSVTLMLENQSKRIKMNEYIKKRDTVGRRLENFVHLPDVLLASASDLPSGASASSHAHYGNYMLSQCLGLDHMNENTFIQDDGEFFDKQNSLTLKTKNCLIKDLSDEPQSWYSLLLMPTEDFKESSDTTCIYSGDQKWSNPIDCFLAGQSSETTPNQQVAFSFDGVRGEKDQGRPLISSVYFRPFCDEDETGTSCYFANRLEFKYVLSHIWDPSLLDPCSDPADCPKNSPIQLGNWPKYDDEFVGITPQEILGNECNEHAKLRFLDEGGIECQCMSPYRQVLVENGGELYYKSNHKGPICELVDPLCGEMERLVGQTVEGVPICERIEEDVITNGVLATETYSFEKTFYSYDSPIYSGSSGAGYAVDICNDSEQEDICSFYSCRYYDHNPEDGSLQSNERVDGWMNDLQISCESYFKLNQVDTHNMYTGESYFEEIVWSITEKTAAIFLALSENALWIPKLITEKSEVNDPNNFSMLGRRELLFPNVGERLLPDTNMATVGGKQMNIPYCNVRRVLADNAPSDAYLYEDPRCPLVVCKYTMTCDYAASNRETPTR